jgi:hypothetical protein
VSNRAAGKNTILPVIRTGDAAMRGIAKAAREDNDDTLLMWVAAFGILVGTYLAMAI